MKKMMLKHSKAVILAEIALHKLCYTDMPPRLKTLIDQQIMLMDDIYWWILHDIYHPRLPLESDTSESDTNALHKEHDDGSKDVPRAN